MDTLESGYNSFFVTTHDSRVCEDFLGGAILKSVSSEGAPQSKVTPLYVSDYSKYFITSVCFQSSPENVYLMASDT